MILYQYLVLGRNGKMGNGEVDRHPQSRRETELQSVNCIIISDLQFAKDKEHLPKPNREDHTFRPRASRSRYHL